LPANYHYIHYTLPLLPQKGSEPPKLDLKSQAQDFGFQSLFGGAFGMGGRVDLWPEVMRQKARHNVAIWKSLRRYVVEDYYPLSAQPADLQSWSGWQFLDPKDQTGFIQTFRTNTVDPRHRFTLQKLDKGARYELTEVYSGERVELTGAD